MTDEITTFTDAFKSFLKNSSLPITAEREKIINLISEMDYHFTIEELLKYAEIKNFPVSRATAYRTLQLLLEAGLLAKLSRLDKPPVYESIFDRRPHNHLFCTICGMILEFESPEIENKISDVSREKNFEKSYHSLKIYGKCSACSPKTRGDGKLSEEKKGYEVTG